jgi:hypothetical protein
MQSFSLNNPKETLLILARQCGKYDEIQLKVKFNSFLCIGDVTHATTFAARAILLRNAISAIILK